MRISTFGLVTVLSVVLACGHQPTPIEQDFIDCAQVDIGKTIPEIGMTIFRDVKTIIEGGKDGWETTLAGIVLKYGNDALACALKATYDEIVAHPPSIAAPPPTPAALRAREAIDARHYKFKGSPHASAPTPPAPPPLAAYTAPSPCYDNLCGMDQYCSCHGRDDTKRCWSAKIDCEGDFACCAKLGTCHGMVADACTTQTADAYLARNKRP